MYSRQMGPPPPFVTGYADTACFLLIYSEETNAYTYYEHINFGDPIPAPALWPRDRQSNGLNRAVHVTVFGNRFSVREMVSFEQTIPVFVSLASRSAHLALIVGLACGEACATPGLEEAIAHGLYNDLSPIKRRIQRKVSGIVDAFQQSY
jgi:hypothetical protein